MVVHSITISLGDGPASLISLSKDQSLRQAKIKLTIYTILT